MLGGLKNATEAFRSLAAWNPQRKEIGGQAVFLKLSRVVPRHVFPQHLFVLGLLNRVCRRRFKSELRRFKSGKLHFARNNH
jgi:hypothetical protein